MFISIVVCTWNRAQLLDATLNEMQKLRIPAGIEWELLVVNNNCSDATDDVISRHAVHLPIRCLFEPKQGLSHARNCAVDAARGELILWTDDDVLVDRDWLLEYVKAAEAYPTVSFFGGRIDPLFSVKPPRWIKRNRLVFSSAYAIKKPGDDMSIIRRGDDIPIGANMAMRKGVFDNVRFDPKLGRCGDNLIGGEEERFFRQLLDEGFFGLWVGPARVSHYIPPERLTRRYLWNYYHGFGESQVRMHSHLDDSAVKAELANLRREYRKKSFDSLRFLLLRDIRWAIAFQSSAITKGMIDAWHAQRQLP